jgi:hypothetical protein
MSHKFEERILSTGLGLIMRDDEYLDADERRRAIRLLDYDAQERNPGLFEGGKVQSFPGCRWISTSLVLGSMRRHIRSGREIIRLVQKALKCDAIRAHDVARKQPEERCTHQARMHPNKAAPGSQDVTDRLGCADQAWSALIGFRRGNAR